MVHVDNLLRQFADHFLWSRAGSDCMRCARPFCLSAAGLGPVSAKASSLFRPCSPLPAKFTSASAFVAVTQLCVRQSRAPCGARRSTGIFANATSQGAHLEQPPRRHVTYRGDATTRPSTTAMCLRMVRTKSSTTIGLTMRSNIPASLQCANSSGIACAVCPTMGKLGCTA